MAKYDYDLVTIGAGSGGVRASRMAAQTGARVAICEEARVGGTCVLRGCVPKKLLVYASHFADEFETAESFGWSVPETDFNWQKLITNKNKELDRLNGVYQRILRDNGVETLNGFGKVVDPHTVDVGGETVTAERILISTGGWPASPNIPGIEHVISSNEALDLPELPKRMVIVGGGYIAVEFAGIFNGLGVEVTEIIRADAILRGFDEDVRVTLTEEMTKAGVDIRSECTVKSIEKTDNGYSLLLDHDEVLETDLVMYATGRKPKIAGLGLEEVGIKLARNGSIIVDEYSQTNIPSIYAVGDVTDRMNLTPVALAEGRAFVETVYNNNPTTVDYDNIPTAVFSQPPIGTVGLGEAEAREKFGKVDIYVSRFRPMKLTLGDKDERTFMKLIVDQASDKVVGCHMVGPDSAEIAQGLGIALKCGATKAQFDATIGIHPTAAEEFVTMRDKLPEHGD
ncbi:MAG: glutathione-disulfide reductase [Alphaproteobacteria bacterium]|nr:glutathione-disulfide reductase [Alphaproteobacteria bacterium]